MGGILLLFAAGVAFAANGVYAYRQPGRTYGPTLPRQLGGQRLLSRQRAMQGGALGLVTMALAIAMALGSP